MAVFIATAMMVSKDSEVGTLIFFGAESVRGGRAELEIQIGEIVTQEGNGERRDWVMAQAEFAQSNGL